MAGLLGRRFAQKLGLPPAGRHLFSVEVTTQDGALIWRRRFGTCGEMVSRFRPRGRWPDGYWIEQTGALQLRLGVDISDGGWRWRLRGARWHGLPLPVFLLPRFSAGKRIVDGRYQFEVRFALPLAGCVLAYGGLLDAE